MVTSSRPSEAVCLLSGGMDSTFAAYWAKRSAHLNPVYAAFINYGQKGAGFEWQASKKIADILGLSPIYYDVEQLAPYLSGAIMSRYELPDDPRLKDDSGHAATFVPGRNLLHLALLSGLLYRTGIKHVVGGWNAVDVDYPDCSHEFLVATGATLALALGSIDEIHIHAPAIAITKDEIVHKGVTMGVPWELTRSCYSDKYHACGACDSCLVRARAFYAVGMVDPAYRSEEAWRRVAALMRKQGYLDE